MSTTQRNLSRRVKGLTLGFGSNGLPLDVYSNNGPRQIYQKRIERMGRQREMLTRTSLQEREGLQHIADGIAGNDNSHWEVQVDGTWEPTQMDIESDNEGWTSEALDTTIADIIVDFNIESNIPRPCRQFDGRTRRDHLLRLHAAWESLYPGMTQAYLEWDCMGPPEDTESGTKHNGIKVYEIFDSSEVRLPLDPNVPFLVSLVHYGYIGSSPLHPACAFSIKMLELFRTMNSRVPSLSIFKFTRGICDLHKISFPSSLRQQFSNAFDVYLQILLRVSGLMNAELQYNTPNWQLQNSCPACTYNVEGEASLKYSMLLCMDGNNSLKRLPRAVREKTSDGGTISTYTERVDHRQITSDLFITAEEVNQFSHEVKRRVAVASQVNSTASHLEEGLLPIDGLDEPTPCTERWTNLADESSKKMWGIFHETGVFTTICRHGVVLLLCDMVRSGELAKYPLALVDRLVGALGPNLMIGYDIGCGFSTTAHRSPKVGPKIISHNTRFCVGSFHGHAHSRICQIDWHPLYVEGCGLEDFEGCERVFSQSNALAGSTHHASTFHRQQSIINYFMHWNVDKYAELSTFILNNYYQALNLIETLSLQLQTAKSILNIDSDTVFYTWLQQEREYITTLRTQPEVDALHIEYVATYRKLWEAESALQKVVVEWNLTPVEELHRSDFYSRSQQSTQDMEGPRLRAIDRVENIRQALNDIERKLGIVEPWSPNSLQWKKVEKLIEERLYRQAVDKLEKLVVARLFELTKLHQSGTGVKLRTHIAKALKARSKAIKNAVEAYNQAALRLSPPRRSIDMATVLEYVYVGEFNLLRESRQDIQSKPWARPAEREATNAFFKLQRAKEEIARLNIEIRRVMTYMADDEQNLQMTHERLLSANPLLSYQICKKLKHVLSLNQVHQLRFRKLQSHSHYTGPSAPGVARRSLVPASFQSLSQSRNTVNGQNGHTVNEDEGSDSETDYDFRNDSLDATIDVFGRSDI